MLFRVSSTSSLAVKSCQLPPSLLVPLFSDTSIVSWPLVLLQAGYYCSKHFHQGCAGSPLPDPFSFSLAVQHFFSLSRQLVWLPRWRAGSASTFLCEWPEAGQHLHPPTCPHPPWHPHGVSSAFRPSFSFPSVQLLNLQPVLESLFHFQGL